MLNSYEGVLASAGFAGEYEELIEAEFAAAIAGAYTIGEYGVYKVSASRTIQLLRDSPIYIQTYQTSAATIRLPSGLIGSNDAEDGRLYFISINSTSIGSITLQNYLGTILETLTVGETYIIIHGDNNSWTIKKISQASGGTYTMSLGGKLPTSNLPLTNIGIEISNGAKTLTNMRAIRGIKGTAGTTTIQLEINGSAVTGTLSWPNTDINYTLKSTIISQAIVAGDRISFRLTASETNAQDIYVEVD